MLRVNPSILFTPRFWCQANEVLAEDLLAFAAEEDGSALSWSELQSLPAIVTGLDLTAVASALSIVAASSDSDLHAVNYGVLSTRTQRCLLEFCLRHTPAMVQERRACAESVMAKKGVLQVFATSILAFLN